MDVTNLAIFMIAFIRITYQSKLSWISMYLLPCMVAHITWQRALLIITSRIWGTLHLLAFCGEFCVHLIYQNTQICTYKTIHYYGHIPNVSKSMVTLNQPKLPQWLQLVSIYVFGFPIDISNHWNFKDKKFQDNKLTMKITSLKFVMYTVLWTLGIRKHIKWPLLNITVNCVSMDK